MVKDSVAYELCLDLSNHRLTGASSTGATSEQVLTGQSAARFYDETLHLLALMGCEVDIERSLFSDDTPRCLSMPLLRAASGRP